MIRLLGILALTAASLCSQDLYPLAIDQDGLSGAPDFSFLNHPLEAADRLFARDGHFCRVGPDLEPFTADDERVRLYGVNLAFGANFPAEEDASRIARRLRRLGVNLVRLHHMDTQPDSNPANAGSLLTRDPYPTLNPFAVSRLRAFLDALKAEGIYCNLNLHVGYTFRPQDGVPAAPAEATYSKPLVAFYPRMIQLQAEYARKVIDALALNDDPVLGMVEINNESSLLASWQNQWSDELDRALGAGEYRDELKRQWNGFLGSKYGDTQTLLASWGPGVPDGASILPDQWRMLEIHGAARALQFLADDGTVRVDILNGSDVIILKQVGFSIAPGESYVAEVEMRADLPDGRSGNVYWDVKRDVSPWDTLKGSTVAVTGQWQKYTMIVQGNFAIEGAGRFGLSVEKVGATIYVRGAALRQAGQASLAKGESLEDATVSLLGQSERATAARAADYVLFLTDRDRAYLDAIRAAVQEKTTPILPVTGTQMGYGGLPNLDSHATQDYLDHHFYIDHYSFPNVSWDGRDWRIADSSSLGTGLGSFLNIAVARGAGKPYTVSEYNQPWPNRQAAEIDPTLAAFASFQDWDALVHFAYSHGRAWDAGVPNGFNINGDWTKFPNIGQSAWIFRTGALQPGAAPIEIPVSQELRVRAARERRGGNFAPLLTAALGFAPETAFVHPVRLAADSAAPVPEEAKAAPKAPYESDTGEFTYDKPGRLFLIHSPMAAGVFGFVNRETASGAIAVELAPSARGFASILVTPLDGRPLGESGRLLLTNPGFTLRTQPGSDPPRPQQLVRYGSGWTLEPDRQGKPSGDLNGGSQPIWMERVEAFVALRVPASRIVVYPLDGAGARLDALTESDVQPIDDGFRIHLQADGQRFAPWYEVEIQHEKPIPRNSVVRSPVPRAGGLPVLRRSGRVLRARGFQLPEQPAHSGRPDLRP